MIFFIVAYTKVMYIVDIGYRCYVYIRW